MGRLASMKIAGKMLSLIAMPAKLRQARQFHGSNPKDFRWW
jgi:hypothetical protein